MTIAHETIEAARALLANMETPRTRKASTAWDALREKLKSYDDALATPQEKAAFEGGDELKIDGTGTLASRVDDGYWLSAWTWIAVEPAEDEE